MTSNVLRQYCVCSQHTTMAAKKSKSEVKAKGQTQEKPEPLQPEKSSAIEEQRDDEKLDFGGLPDRDLKKNLGGCG